MTAIANAFAEQTTNQSTTSTTYGAVSGAQLASSNFVAGQKYLILVGAQTSRSLSSGNGGLRVAHGGTAFAELEWVYQPNLANTRLSYFAFVVWTAVSGEAIDLQMKATTGTTNADQIVLWSVRLDADLTEGTDWHSNVNTTSNALGTAFENGASVTFTPANANDIWLLLHEHQATANLATSQGESRADLSGGTTANWGLVSEEGEDTAVDIHFHAFLRAISLPASSHTFRVQGRSESADVFTHLRSAVFALNLSKFKDVSQVFTATAVGYSTTSWASAVQTLAHTKTVDGNVLILAANVDDLAATTTTATHRLQVDNVDQPGTQTADIYPTSPTDNDSTDQGAWHLFTRESLTANITIDHDGHSNVATTPTYSDRALVCFSMELAAAGGITEADGNASGAATVASVAAAIWNVVTAAAGIAASAVVGAALWLSVASGAGVGTPAATGATVLQTVGSATAVATPEALAATVWATVFQSAGAATGTAEGADGAFGGQGTATGVATATGSSAATAGVEANAAGAATVLASAATVSLSAGASVGTAAVQADGVDAAAGSTAQAFGSAAVSGVSGTTAGSVASASGVAMTEALTATWIPCGVDGGVD